MRVLGGLAILLAAFLGLGAYNSYSNANKLRGELTKQGGFTKFVGNATGLNEIDRMRIQALEDQGQKLAIAAGVVGLLGLIFCASGGSRQPAYYPPAYERQRRPEAEYECPYCRTEIASARVRTCPGCGKRFRD